MVPSLRMEGRASFSGPKANSEIFRRVPNGVQRSRLAPNLLAARQRGAAASLSSGRSLPGRPCASRSSPRLEPRAPPSPSPPVSLWPARTHCSLRLAAHDTQHHTALILTALRPAACTQHGARTPARPFGPAVTASATQHTQPAAPCELLMGAASRTLTAALPNRHARTPAGSGVGDGVGVRVPVQPAASDPSTCARPRSRASACCAQGSTTTCCTCTCTSTCTCLYCVQHVRRGERVLCVRLPEKQDGVAC